MRTTVVLICIWLASIAHSQVPTPPPTNLPYVSPIQYGGDPTGKEDSTKALLQAATEAQEKGGELYIPPGYWKGCLELNNVRGLRIRGDSRGRTVLRSNVANKPALKITGLWYSTIENLTIGTSKGLTNCGVVEIDKGAERGIQGNTFKDLYIAGRGADDGVYSRYCLTMCKEGSSSAQGSEQVFLNCHFSGASEACYYQIGYNALNNQFIGGNFQDYRKHGMQVIFGSFHVFGVGFQSVAGYGQIKSDGWDIVADSGGVGDGLFIAGCRTESLRFMKASGAQPPHLTSCNQRIALPRWFPNVQYKVDDAISRPIEATATTPQKTAVFRCTKEHKSGAQWDAPNWEEVQFNVVDVYESIIDNCHWEAGIVNQRSDSRRKGLEVKQDIAVPPSVSYIFVNAVGGNITITPTAAEAVPEGYELMVIKGDSSSNEVRVHAPYFNNGSEQWITLTSEDRIVTLKALGGGDITRRYYRVK